MKIDNLRKAFGLVEKGQGITFPLQKKWGESVFLPLSVNHVLYTEYKRLMP